MVWIMEKHRKKAIEDYWSEDAGGGCEGWEEGDQVSLMLRFWKWAYHGWSHSQTLLPLAFFHPESKLYNALSLSTNKVEEFEFTLAKGACHKGKIIWNLVFYPWKPSKFLHHALLFLFLCKHYGLNYHVSLIINVIIYRSFHWFYNSIGIRETTFIMRHILFSENLKYGKMYNQSWGNSGRFCCSWKMCHVSVGAGPGFWYLFVSTWE